MIKILVSEQVKHFLSENKLDTLRDVVTTHFNGRIDGRFLNKNQSEELQKEIEYYYARELGDTFNPKKDDIRNKIYTYDNPLAEKNINGINLRIANGLIRNNKQTYLLYADGNIIGEFYSVNDIKIIVKYIEDNLIKNLH